MLQQQVQEIQGLYGPFSLSERVLQKIWLRGDFNQSDLSTASGKTLRILDPGRWNLLEGPDFLEAQLELAGQKIVADVEVHFYASDWQLHAHSTNPGFKNVRLHVVLYARKPEVRVTTSAGVEPELFYLLPQLERDLEAYAVDEALLELEQVEDATWMLDFMQYTLEARRAKLHSTAETRWLRKVDFSKRRLAGASWREACHQYCLEVLGYARNRAPMSQIALRYSIEDFASERVCPEVLFEEARPDWRLNGLRPANHPRHRLAQYSAICRARPDWPEQLRSVLTNLKANELPCSGAAFRKRAGLPKLRQHLATEVFAETISAKRLNTLVCDALLPLAQAAGLADVSVYWMEWPAGDAPEVLHRFLKRAQVIDRAEPFSNGQVQGALQLLLSA